MRDLHVASLRGRRINLAILPSELSGRTESGSGLTNLSKSMKRVKFVYRSQENAFNRPRRDHSMRFHQNSIGGIHNDQLLLQTIHIGTVLTLTSSTHLCVVARLLP